MSIYEMNLIFTGSVALLVCQMISGKSWIDRLMVLLAMMIFTISVFGSVTGTITGDGIIAYSILSVIAFSLLSIKFTLTNTSTRSLQLAYYKLLMLTAKVVVGTNVIILCVMFNLFAIR